MVAARRSSPADPIVAAIVAADDPTDVRIKAGEELDVTLRWNHNGSPGTRSAHTLERGRPRSGALESGREAGSMVAGPPAVLPSG